MLDRVNVDQDNREILPRRSCVSTHARKSKLPSPRVILAGTGIGLARRGKDEVPSHKHSLRRTTLLLVLLFVVNCFKKHLLWPFPTPWRCECSGACSNQCRHSEISTKKGRSSRSLQCQPFSAAFDGVSRTCRFKYVGRNPGLGSGRHHLGDLIERLER